MKKFLKSITAAEDADSALDDAIDELKANFDYAVDGFDKLARNGKEGQNKANQILLQLAEAVENANKQIANGTYNAEKFANDLVKKYSTTDADLSKEEMKALQNDIKHAVKNSVDGGALGKLGDIIKSSKNAQKMYAIQTAGHSLEAASSALGVYTEVKGLTAQLKGIKASHEANAQGQEATTQQVEQKPDYSAEIAERAARYLRNR